MGMGHGPWATEVSKSMSIYTVTTKYFILAFQRKPLASTLDRFLVAC